MTAILVIGASGFIGRRLAAALLRSGHAVRCFARDPSRVADLAAAGGEVARGDVVDAAAVARAMQGVDAVYIAIHTLSPQPSAPGRGFMDVERAGIANVIAAARTNGVRRAIYVTSVGVSPDGPGEWLRERWRTERMLLDSGLDATVIGPGMIVGRGGRGFEAVLANARRRFAVLLGDGRLRMRTIALDNLITYLIDIRDEPRVVGRRFDVGGDDVLSTREMIDAAADVLGRPHPLKLPTSRPLLGAAAPLIERLAGMPPGAMRGLLDSMSVDGIGDPAPIRTLLPRPLLSFREAVRNALDDRPEPW